MPPFVKQPAIRGKRIAGFLLVNYIRNKTYWKICICIFLIPFYFLITEALALEVSSSNYTAQLVEFMQGGGYTASSSLYAQYTAVGGGLISLEQSQSGNFYLLSGFIHLLSLVTRPSEATLITDLTCRTDVFGNFIPVATWQRDTDPYFYWLIVAKPESLVNGFSISLDEEPDEAMDTTNFYYQYPDSSITGGKHTFYVLPYTSGEGWRKDNQLSFEIWVDVEAPFVNQSRPVPGEITANSLAPISCTLSDAHSGADPDATTLTLNGSLVAFTYDANSKWLEHIPQTPHVEGENTILLKAFDYAGNYVVNGWNFLVDTLPPAGSLKINNAEELTHSAYVFLNIEAQDALSGVKTIYLSNDGVFDAEMTQPRAFNTLISNWLLSQPDTDGLKFVYVKFADGVGNVSQAYRASIILKRLTPDTNIISGPSATTDETSAAFLYEASKLGCRFSTKLDNQEWSAWGSSKEASFSGLSLGNHYFYVKSAYDLNGDNSISIDEEDETPASRVWTVMTKQEIKKLKEKILFWRR
ncbi:MAG: hypothetical protein ABIG31_01355 [Candidatus Omnitrophota bacterium]